MDINDIKEKAQELNGKAVSGVIDAKDRFEAKRAKLNPLKKFFNRLPFSISESATMNW